MSVSSLFHIGTGKGFVKNILLMARATFAEPVLRLMSPAPPNRMAGRRGGVGLNAFLPLGRDSSDLRTFSKNKLANMRMER
jgi:hypothetical protein